jgi:hypothetical protein
MDLHVTLLKWVLEWGGMDWIDLTQDRYQWRSLVNTERSFGLYKTLGNSSVAAQLAVSQEGLISVELVITSYLLYAFQLTRS